MLATAIIISGAAILVATTFHSFRLPPIVAFLMAGVLVGPYGLKLINSSPQIELITELATVLLMFTIGLEFSFKELMQYKKPILVLGLSQILITLFVFTYLFSFIFDFSIEKSIFISFLIAPSSTAIVFKLLHDNRDFESPYGRAAFSVLLMQDIAFIPMVVAIPFLISQQNLPTTLLENAFPLTLLFFATVGTLIAFNKYALPYLLYRVSLTKNREIFFFAVMFLCMLFSAIMHRIGLSYSLGAFIAGILLAGSYYGKQAISEVLPLRDAFLSLFFIVIGMLLDLGFIAQNWHRVLLIGFFVILIKSVILYSVMWLTGSSRRISRAFTVLLFQFGEFSLILAELGFKNNIISASERQIFLAITIVSIGATPLLYARISHIMENKNLDKHFPKILLTPAHSLREQILKRISGPISYHVGEESAKDHVVIIGYGVAGKSLARILQNLNVPLRVIELNAETVRLHSRHVPIVFGDATSSSLLKKVGVENAKLITILTSGAYMLSPVLASIRKLNPTVKVIARTNYILDLKKLPVDSHTQYVTNEIESTLQIIDSTLADFSIDNEIRSSLVDQLRTELGTISPA